MPSASGIGRPFLPIHPSYRIFRPIERILPKHISRSEFSASSSTIIGRDWDTTPFCVSNGVRAGVALHAAGRSAAAASQHRILDVMVPASIEELWVAISDPHLGLLVELHRSLASENFCMRSAAALPNEDSSVDVSELSFVLTFTTPLPLVSMRAENTEKLSFTRTDPRSFSIASSCSTAGVPLGNCFVNRLQWEAEAVGTTSTRLTITAHTEFIVPVLGVLRSQIERESLKGIGKSYAVFEDVLRRRYHDRPFPHALSPSVSNLRHSGAMSASELSRKSSSPSGKKSTPSSSQNSFTAGNLKITVKRSVESSDNNSSGRRKKSEPLATTGRRNPPLKRMQVDGAAVLSLQSTDLGARISDSDSEVEVDPSTIDQNDTEEKEEEEDEEQDDYRTYPHRVALREFRRPTLSEIKDAVRERWPTWVSNSYWLLRSGRHGGAQEVDAPTPDEAVGLLWAVGTATAGRRVYNWHLKVPSDALVRGLVECLRLQPARKPPLSFRNSSHPNSRFSKQNNAKHSSTVTAGRSPAPDGNGTSLGTTFVAAESRPSSIHPRSLSAAMFCLGWLGRDAHFAAEMEVLCTRLPEAEFNTILHVYNVIWALRSSRHWTKHLTLLEAEVIRLLQNMAEGEGGISNRQVRHASYCAQGLVHFGHVPRDLFQALAPIIEEFWDWRMACSLAWAVTIANELDSPAVPALLRGMQANAEESLGSDGEGSLGRRVTLSKLWQLLVSLERMRPGSVDERNWSPAMVKLVERSEREWETLVLVEKKLVSSSQKEVHRAMLSMGYAADLESTACGLSVDVAVPDMNLSVEVDGFAHFARNKPNLAVGNSLWKRRLLEANGWTMVNVNVWEWCRKRGAGVRRDFLRDMIEKEAVQRLRGKENGKSNVVKKKTWRRPGKKISSRVHIKSKETSAAPIVTPKAIAKKKGRSSKIKQKSPVLPSGDGKSGELLKVTSPA